MTEEKGNRQVYRRGDKTIQLVEIGEVRHDLSPTVALPNARVPNRLIEIA